MLDHKMQETNSKTPREFMEWENKLLRSYHENVFRAMKWLQTSLINTHPNVIISTLTFICFLDSNFVSAKAVSCLPYSIYYCVS